MIEFVMLRLATALVVLTVLFPIVWIIIKLLPSSPAVLHRFAWGGLLLVPFLALSVPLNLPLLRAVHEPGVSAPGWVESGSTVEHPGTAPSTAPSPALFEASTPIQEKPPALALTSILFGIWLGGLLAILGHRMFLHVKLLLLLRNKKPADAETLAEWKEICRQYGVFTENIPVFLTESTGPAIVRLGVNTTLLLPEAIWEELPISLRKGVLRHEIAHYLHGDVFLSPLMHTLAAIQWFNPLSWFTLRKYNVAVEWSCDDVAYRTADADSATLAETFLTIHRNTESLGLYLNTFSRFSTLDRIDRLIRYEKQGKETMMKKLLVFTLLSMLFLGGLFRVQLVARTETEPQNAKSEQGENSATIENALKEFSESALRNAIHSRVISVECEKRGIRISEKDIDDEIERKAKSFKMSKEDWLNLLEKEKNMDSKSYIDLTTKTLEVQKLLELDRKITPSSLNDAEFVTQSKKYVEDLVDKAKVDVVMTDPVRSKQSPEVAATVDGHVIPRKLIVQQSVKLWNQKNSHSSRQNSDKEKPASTVVPPGSTVSTPTPPALARETPKPVEDVKWVEVKGIVVAPNEEPLQDVELMAIGLTEEGQCTNGGQCKKDGTFTMKLFPNAHYIIGVVDEKNRFTAPYYEIPIGTEKPQNDITIMLEKGTPLEVKFVDKETGKPIPGLRINLDRKVKATGNFALQGSIMFNKMTDAEGRFLANVLPGEYTYSVDYLLHDPEAVNEGIYARKITVEKDKPFSLEVRIPPPFIGKVIRVDGTPADNCSVYSPGKRLFVYITGKDGLFRAAKPMENATIRIGGPNDEQYFSWVKDELVPLKEFTFQLVKPVKVTGRLLDAETKEPLVGRMICNWKKNPNDPRLKEYLPDTKITDKEGKFTLKLIPSLKYDLFVVHGRNEQYGGGPYYPRINLTELQPTADMDLGDLLVDPKKAVDDPTADRVKIFIEAAKLVQRGEKMSVMKIFVKKNACDAWDYIDKHKNEEPFASFAFVVTKWEETAESFRRELEDELNKTDSTLKNQPLLLCNDPILSSTPADMITFSQLRGEKESPWNVPKDDPSVNGDWKKSPGMVNPKILDNYLKDMLRKTEAERGK